jgi:hypothetical protein
MRLDVSQESSPFPGETTIHQAGESGADTACSSYAGLVYAGEILGILGCMRSNSRPMGFECGAGRPRTKALVQGSSVWSSATGRGGSIKVIGVIGGNKSGLVAGLAE